MTLDEISAELAEVSDSVLDLRAQVETLKSLTQSLSELVLALRNQPPAAAPQISMNIPQAPQPVVKVVSQTVAPIPQNDYVIAHEWGVEYGQIVCKKSTVTRREVKNG